jgi:hypothetical protein
MEWLEWPTERVTRSGHFAWLAHSIFHASGRSEQAPAFPAAQPGSHWIGRKNSEWPAPNYRPRAFDFANLEI